MTGKLVSFEGGEGSGKSTQARLLFGYLQTKNISAILTREPGGTSSAEKIRNILVTGNLDKLDKTSEILLHYAARNENIKKVERLGTFMNVRPGNPRKSKISILTR